MAVLAAICVISWVRSPLGRARSCCSFLLLLRLLLLLQAAAQGGAPAAAPAGFGHSLIK